MTNPNQHRVCPNCGWHGEHGETEPNEYGDTGGCPECAWRTTPAADIEEAL